MGAMEANNRCEVGGPKPSPRFTAAQAGAKDTYVADDRVGAFPPLGFWDPWGLSTECTEGQLAYIREAELKHGHLYACYLGHLRCREMAPAIWRRHRWDSFTGHRTGRTESVLACGLAGNRGDRVPHFGRKGRLN